MKIVILGNSGSGKTWLAHQLAKHVPVPMIHLDDLYWEPGGFNRRRSMEEISALVQESKFNAGWIVEGVFGDLATRYLEYANELIWLDPAWQVCEARLLKRRSESKRHMDREQSERGLKDLLDWACGYYVRSDLRSQEGHRQLFTEFRRSKYRLEDEASVAKFVSKVQQMAMSRLEIVDRPRF